MEDQQDSIHDKTVDDIDDPNTTSGKKYLALQQQVCLTCFQLT